VDIYETDDQVVIRIDLPGVDQKAIDLRIEDGTLILRGERKLPSGESREDFLRIERTYGSFHRTFRLPGTVDQGSVEASHRNGVLEVVLSKRESSKPQAIRIDVK
jgi:HSP20 family protein